MHRYRQENILIHEFAHAIRHMAINQIDPEFDKKLKAAYDDAMTKGLWKTFGGGVKLALGGEFFCKI